MKRKSINQGLSICALLILVILIPGCVTIGTRMYKGEELPIQEIAVIKESSAVDICSVDEELLQSRWAGLHNVEVKSGFHKVVVRIREVQRELWDTTGLFRKHVSYYYKLEFTVEAGHQYKIKTPYLSSETCPPIFLVDTQSGAVIASSRDCDVQTIGGVRRRK